MPLDKQKGMEWLTALEDKLGYPPSTLAREIGMAPSTLNRPANPDSEYTLTQNSVARVIAWMAALGNSRPDLRQAIQALAVQGWQLTGRKAAPPSWDDDLSVVIEAANEPEKVKGSVSTTVPLYGTAAGSIIGAMQLEEGMQVTHLDRPPGLKNSPLAYALKVVGDSMAPKYSEGDLVFVDPSWRIDPGDTVIIQTKNFNQISDEPVQAYIKIYKGILGNKLFAGQLNPKTELTYLMETDDGEMELVYAYHRVMTTAELFEA